MDHMLSYFHTVVQTGAHVSSYDMYNLVYEVSYFEFKIASMKQHNWRPT